MNVRKLIIVQSYTGKIFGSPAEFLWLLYELMLVNTHGHDRWFHNTVRSIVFINGISSKTRPGLNCPLGSRIIPHKGFLNHLQRRNATGFHSLFLCKCQIGPQLNPCLNLCPPPLGRFTFHNIKGKCVPVPCLVLMYKEFIHWKEGTKYQLRT